MSRAFPYGNHKPHAFGLGITMRQYYATKAMQGLLANPHLDLSHSDVVAKAFQIADEMLAVEEVPWK